MNAFINYLDKYHSQLTVLLLGLSLIVLAVFLWLWFYNRRKYHHLKHQIPASVVKNYLDSIIQNSTALKSSLFRGGGLDVDGDGVPSVMPLSDLPSGADVNISGGDDDSALRAELSKLQAQLNEKNGVIKDLEDKNAQLGGDVKAKQERIEELEKLLAAAKEAGGGGDPEADAKIAKLQEEKDALEEDLKQYELIADDIAENKRLKQENAQLKKALEEAGGDVPEAPVEAAAPEPAEEEPEAEEQAEEPAAAEEAPAPAEEEEEDEMAAATEEDSSDVEPAAKAEPEEAEAEEPAAQEAAAEEPLASEDSEEEDSKSPEDLLSEFEKMLG